MAKQYRAEQSARENEESTVHLDRERLPDTRDSVVHKFSVSGQEGYLIVGLYPDGRPGELFIKIAKEGSTLAGLYDTVGIITSMALQYGTPIEALAEKLKHTHFEPAGHTKNPDIPYATSLSDYIFQWLGQTFGEKGSD